MIITIILSKHISLKVNIINTNNLHAFIFHYKFGKVLDVGFN